MVFVDIISSDEEIPRPKNATHIQPIIAFWVTIHKSPKTKQINPTSKKKTFILLVQKVREFFMENITTVSQNLRNQIYIQKQYNAL